MFAIARISHSPEHEKQSNPQNPNRPFRAVGHPGCSYAVRGLCTEKQNKKRILLPVPPLSRSLCAGCAED
jgi:hypothetical protein